MTSVVAQHLASVSPSRAHALRECFLKVAFAQASPAPGKRSDAQLVGDAAHATLDALIRTGPPYDAGLATIAEDFAARLERESRRGPVRGARPAAARLRKVATRVVALADEAGESAEVQSELHLTSHDGRLNGKLDLVLFSASLHAVVDYKTGAVMDDEDTIASHVQEQLALYCALERERSGFWPKRAVLLPFGAQAVDWPVDANVCELVVQEALDLRLRYLEYEGQAPPASPSTDVCRHCAFAPRCEAFWDAVSPEWTSHVNAVRGIVVWAERSAGGGVTIRLRAAEGTRDGDVLVQRLPAGLPDEHLVPGTRIAAVGLWVDRDRQLTGAPYTRIWID